MSQYAIEVMNLSKRYQRGSGGRIQNLGDVARAFRQPFAPRPDDSQFWALKDVSFALPIGAILGIVGANGAGKSTLLKILSRIVAPTEGKIIMNGRVGALLEVGTGFHDELTGRENVFLNGAILGLKRHEIARLFDEIVAFSGVEEFIDTPVKHYSSGMRLRLGFAVAAHLNPEILIIDEVLAVGDAEFQRKSIAKMKEVASGGRTVIFVSHSPASVLNLCNTAIHLQHGQIVMMDTAETVIQTYLAHVRNPNQALGFNRVQGMTPILQSITLHNQHGERIDECNTGDAVTFEIAYDCGDATYHSILIGIKSPLGDRLFSLSTAFSPDAPTLLQGRGVMRCTIDHLPLRDGEYSLVLAVKDHFGANCDHIDNALTFQVHFNNYFKTGISLLPMQGYIVQDATWKN
jgi:lipopolysaccharide transport system ATP-binding protein